MALQLSEVQASGVSADYWKISLIQIMRDLSRIQVNVDLYVSKVVRDNGSSPLNTSVIMISDGDFAGIMTSDNIVAAIYAHLKNLPDFAGASDV